MQWVELCLDATLWLVKFSVQQHGKHSFSTQTQNHWIAISKLTVRFISYHLKSVVLWIKWMELLLVEPDCCTPQAQWPVISENYYSPHNTEIYRLCTLTGTLLTGSDLRSDSNGLMKMYRWRLGFVLWCRFQWCSKGNEIRVTTS